MSKYKQLLLKTKKWFTLVELLVVITIITILSIMATNLDFNKKTSKEKAERFMNQVVSIIDTEKINSKIWRWIKIWSGIVNIDFAKIKISTWSINVLYYTGNSISSLNFAWSGASIKYPYYKESLYEINLIQFLNSSWSVINTASPWKNLDIIFSSDNIYLSWSDIANTSYTNMVWFKIKLWYRPDYKSIEFDKRTWKTEVK